MEKFSREIEMETHSLLLATVDSNTHMLKLFLKEAQLLQSLSCQENILKIHGFNAVNNSMLLEFVKFDFEQIGISHDSVFNLKELLQACDTLCSFEGFEHLQYFLATDIARGMDFLHKNGIVHRDLKPDNILVSNRHYENDKESNAISYWWTNRPIIAKLTDFGESRSDLIQTKTLAQTTTAELYRGSPAYMAPEVLSEQQTRADMTDLQKMDIWALGMVFFHLINPNARHPYAAELEKGEHKNPTGDMKKYMTSHKVPNMLTKYSETRAAKWTPIVKAFQSCSVFQPSVRPNAGDVYQSLLNDYIDIENLLISQNTAAEISYDSVEVMNCKLSTMNACCSFKQL